MSSFFNDVTGEAVAAFVPLVLDSTGKFAFNPDSLASAYTYDGNGNLATETRGPDQHGNSFRKTYTFTNGSLTGESQWAKVIA